MTKRGDLIICADRSGRYTGKPRPAVIVQADALIETDSVTICLITHVKRDAPIFRVPIGKKHGLSEESFVMIDKVTTVARNQVAKVIGRADDETMLAINRALMVFLDLV